MLPDDQEDESCPWAATLASVRLAWRSPDGVERVTSWFTWETLGNGGSK